MRIGIDLGGTKIEGIVLGAQNHILKRLRLPTPQGDYFATLQAIGSLVAELERGFVDAPTKLPLGIATPGSISSLTGRMKNCNSTCLNDQPLKEDLEALLDRDIRMANDADCFALSEAMDGAAAPYHSVFGVILGTGVGAGIVIGKHLLSGPNNIAGEWGHNPMPSLLSENGNESLSRSCYCGRINCIESYLSGPAIEAGYFHETGQRLSVADIVKLMNSQSEAKRILDEFFERLAAALAVVINILDPDVIVLGGGLSNIEPIYQEIPSRWLKYVFSDSCNTRLVKADHGDSSGVRGAAWLWP